MSAVAAGNAPTSSLPELFGSGQVASGGVPCEPRMLSSQCGEARGGEAAALAPSADSLDQEPEFKSSDFN